MLTVVAVSEADDSTAAVTDGGGGADMLRARAAVLRGILIALPGQAHGTELGNLRWS
jgi:hypothetical protein